MIAPPPHRLAPLDDAARLDWLRLARSENVGPATFWSLLARYGTASAALEALPGLARRGGRTAAIRIASRQAAEREWEALAKAGARLIALGDEDYPPGLAHIDDAPPVLCIRGRSALLREPAVAVVGARNASALGRRLAETLAAELGAAGYAVVSGLARGIDTAAHCGAIGTGTIAVLAGGIDHIYPLENEALHEAIAEQGVLVSEMPLGFTPQARHFPRRNRIVSGSALGTVVIEAALKSGSLITARMALEQGREVFAVPGSPLDPRARGANNLIRQGAVLTESAADVTAVLDEMRSWAGRSGFAEADGPLPPLPLFEQAFADETAPADGHPPPGLDDARAALRPLLGPTPTRIDDLIRTAGHPAGLCLTVLLEWEIAGTVLREPGGRFVLADIPDALSA